ncbi:MAG TPA: NADH-quinone oxidoreductase subunit A [Candidatus Thermoplasmatota archaeon]
MADLQLGYLPIAILGIIALTLVFATLFGARMMGPRNPNARKESTYECGEIALGSGRGPIEIQYYMYILVFLIIDIEAIFLIPFAVRFSNLGTAAIWEMAIFVALLFVGWLYALKKGALNWVR